MEAISSSSSPSICVLLSSARSRFLSSQLRSPVALRLRTSSRDCGSGPMSVVECSSRPQKKCTAHHNKTRPKKHNPSDKNRKPAVYPRRPKPPPVVTLGWVDPPPVIDSKKRKPKPSKLDDWLEIVSPPTLKTAETSTR